MLNWDRFKMPAALSRALHFMSMKSMQVAALEELHAFHDAAFDL